MKKSSFLYALAGLCGLLTMGSCSSEEAYETSVTRDISLFLNDQPWSIYYGTSNKPLFIFKADGEYVANYSSSYRFSLEDGSYKIVLTDQSTLVDQPLPLDELTVPQDTLAKQTFAMSAPTDYQAGDKMEVRMYTRTGVLRLKSTDAKADKSYSTVRAVVTTPITAYKIGNASYLEDEANPVVITRDKGTSNGGINYEDDIVLLGTQANSKQVNVRIDYLDAQGNIVNSKPFADGIELPANDTTLVSFALNNADEPIIQNYTIALASQDWQEQTVRPDAPVVAPDGYTYVSPSDNLDAVFNQLKADATVDEIKIYLKANEVYAFGSNTLSNLNKALSIKAQKPGKGQQRAQLSLGAISMTGTLSEIAFENITFSAGSRFFNLKNQEFNVGTISFKNCEWRDWNGGTMWYQQTNADHQQVVNTVLMENCSYINVTVGKSALWGLSTKKIAPVYNWIFRNNTFHGDFGSSNAILNGLTKVDGTMTIELTGNTFASTTAFTGTLFNIDGKATDETTLTVKDNRFGGVSATGRAFKLGTYDTLSDTGNTRTQGYTLSDWGISEPTETTQSGDDFLNEIQ